MFTGGMNRPTIQRDGKGICPVCGRRVQRGGIKHWDYWYHRQCLRQQEHADMPTWKARRTEV